MKTLAKISGIVYLLIFIFGFYANFAILESLIDLNNREQTTLNIINNSVQFKQGLIGFWIMLISDVVLIWLLFKITEPIHKSLSYMASLFRGLHAFCFLIALTKLVKVYNITGSETNSLELQTSVISLLKKFDEIWTVGLLFFGVHLLILGGLTLKSKSISRFIGFILILAALGYFIDGFSKLFLPSCSNHRYYFEVIVIFTGVVGELSFTIWLLIKGFSRKIFNV